MDAGDEGAGGEKDVGKLKREEGVRRLLSPPSLAVLERVVESVERAGRVVDSLTICG